MAGAHAGHSHDANEGRLALALALILGFMAAEIATGIVARSLALLSDAAHMLTDAGAVALSLLAARLARRPAAGAMTFGLGRAEILSAQANGVTLLLLAGLITYGAVRRLIAPAHVHAELMLAVALAGIVVSLAASGVLAGAGRRNLSVEGSFQHVLTDLFAFIGTALAAGVILLSGFQRADPIASLLIAALMIRSGLSLVRASARVFLEAAPHGLDPAAVGRALAELPAVVEVHDLHVWEVRSGFAALSAHVLVGASEDCHAERRRMEALLAERFGLEHTTLQVDHAAQRLLDIEPIEPPATRGRAAARP